MTENEAIKELETSRNLAKMCTQNSERKREIESYEIAIKALEEIQAYRAIGTVKEIMDMLFSTEQEHDEVLKYRAIGTVEEFKALKEKEERFDRNIRMFNEIGLEIRANAIDEFAEFLHKKAKENNGLRLSSETRSWTHASIYDYVREFRETQMKGGGNDVETN